MGILLTAINSKYIHSNLAIKCLNTAAKDSPCPVKMREFTINNSEDYIFGELLCEEYNMISFSCYIWNIEMVLSLTEDLKKARPELIISVGGPEVSHDVGLLMKENPQIDIVSIGEGEESFKQLCDAFYKVELGEAILSEIINDIEGIAYRKGSEIIINEKKSPSDFSNFPFPYADIEIPKDKIIYYESSRGCPYRCSYCLSSIDKIVRALPLDRVKEELLYFIGKNVKQVKFIDRTFNYDRKRALELWKFLIDNDNGIINFHFEICAALLNEEALELLKTARSGLFQFEIGIQSTNSEVIRAVERKTDVRDTIEMTQKVIELGNISVHTDLIAGLPYEDMASFRNSFNEVYEMGAENLHFGFLKLLRGTSIRERADEFGYKFKAKPPYEVISNNFISAIELQSLRRMENVFDLYYNRGGFSKSLEYMINTYGDTTFDMFLKFADFYYNSGFQTCSHKKEDLYRIALLFAKEMEHIGIGSAKKMQDILMSDMEENLNFDAVKKFKNKGWEICKNL